MLVQPTPNHIQAATKEELQEMLNKALQENLKLEASACDAWMSAAHHKLQYNLLSIESQEALNRMEVENYMFRREAAILRKNPIDATLTVYHKRLKEHCAYIKEDNIALRLALKKANCIIKAQDLKLATSQQVIKLLKERIQQNRKHLNIILRPGQPIFQAVSPGDHAQISLEPLETPQINFTPKSRCSLQRNQVASCDNQENFDALLLAGSILDRERMKKSSPTTPYRQLHHSPEVQKQNSLITGHSKTRGYLRSSKSLLPPAQFSSEVKSGINTRSKFYHTTRIRRCKSRDSTISASDVEEPAQLQVQDIETLGSELIFNDAETCYSRNQKNSLVQVDGCSLNEELSQTRITTPMTKRKRVDGMHWWERERKKGRNKKVVELAIG
ncbi:putative fad-dependent oxidoreductase-like enzyme [Golovinomyces cichoracearum]|uniref:Putative fad-dependent oxidoreductase-like enzyme n=1 Tax=Golovinomyces cichoracearum TaxID=62708 RepID=A0A420J551_9PEZI|nr:putative fad-dependent oxidoreductase-like enzyme [Golovinomyces cichoracearum]